MELPLWSEDPEVLEDWVDAPDEVELPESVESPSFEVAPVEEAEPPAVWVWVVSP